ncbi:MAG: alanine racemase [Miltoncostaeaceae bacterium]
MTGGWTRVEVDLGAVRHNARTLSEAAGGAGLIAVVKSDGYGHGAVPVARAVTEAGAAALAVVAVDEARELRQAGLDGPILLLGPLAGEGWREALDLDLDLTVWTAAGVGAAAAAGAHHPDPPRVHLKLDTGMGRLGARPEDVPALAGAAAEERVRVVGLMTHFACADETAGENAGFMREQMIRFRATAADLGARFPEAVQHAANSAATLRDATTACGAVRCGIALYGCDPFHEDPVARGLRPAMRWVSRISQIKTVRSRESVGYGRRWRAARGAVVATVPVGYGDGYARALGGRAEALVGGRRVPVIGAVSMNQIALDLGPEGGGEVGDEVVLLGAQGDERITAEELARHRDSINYEIVCAVGPRLARVYL